MFNSRKNDPNSGSYAVDVQNVVFGYKKNVKVLNRITVRIPEGKIFALLGSNGSGKTTLLRLILGRFKARSGTIHVFGGCPASKYSLIPGPGVGYMPQETALFAEFTIREILIYYAIVYHMNRKHIDHRIDELIQLLNLPKKDKRIGQLSGGQQRLVSVAVTMIHRPRLLILDEPTVGVDSLLRLTIWQYLENECKQNGLTVIITTHYIEEARSAHNVGFNYGGRCLKYATPDHLLRQYECQTLEDVYFKLIKEFIQKSKETFKSVIEEEAKNKFISIESILSEKKSEKKTEIVKKTFDWQRIQALIWRNGIIAKGNCQMFLFYYLLPIIQIFIIGLCFGRPQNIPIGIYNGESDAGQLSTAFIDRMDDRLFRKTYYRNNESAIESVVKGKNYLSIEFSNDFTQAFKDRFLEPNEVTDEELDISRIKVYADMSNTAIGYFAQIYLIETLQKFFQYFGQTIGHNPRSYSMPFDLEEEIHGQSAHMSYDHFLCPGFVLAVIQGLSILITTYYAFYFVNDRKNGFLERGFVAGITNIEILFVQSLMVCTCIAVQALMIIVMLFVVYDYPLNGSYFDVYLLLLLQGIQGLAFGTTIALLCQSFTSAAVVICFALWPQWLTSGMFWPQESTPAYVQNIMMYSPLSTSVTSMRLIMYRGWSPYTSMQVGLGYLVVFAYILVFSILNIVLMKDI